MIAVCLCLVYQIQLPFCSRCRKLTAKEVRLTMQAEHKIQIIFQRHKASHHYFAQSAAEFFSVIYQDTGQTAEIRWEPVRPVYGL